MKKRSLSHKRFFFAKPSSVTEYTRCHQQSLFSIFVFGVFLSGCSTLLGKGVDPMISSPTAFTFDQYEIVTGVAKHQTVLTGFLFDGPLAELAVVSISENNNRHLHIYAFDGDTWVPKLDVPLRPEILFVDVANISGRDCLIMYEQGRLNWFHPESATEHPLVAVPANYNVMKEDEIPHVDITHDLNGNGLDDLVVPDINGFKVFVQMNDGTFADPVKLGTVPEIERRYSGKGYRYNPWRESGIHKVDYNQDGRNDLVFWNKDHFEVHYQNEYGLFAPTAEIFTTDIAFDSDDLASLAAPYGVRRRRFDHNPTGALTGRVLHALTDLNGDGVADLGVFSLKGGSLWHMHFTYEVHFGTPVPDGGTVFASDVSTAIQVDGIPFGMEPHDFDPDGQVDMMFTTFKPRISKIIGMIISGLLTRSGSMDLKFYCMEDSTYPDQANATRKIKTDLPGKSGEKAALFPTLLIGDVTGDGRSDLLLQNGRKELRVFVGVPGLKPFAQRPRKIKVPMPNEEYTWLVDLNKDSKQDLLIHHPSTTDPHRVILLIAQ